MIVRYERSTFFFWLRLLLVGVNVLYIGYEYNANDALGLKKQWCPERSNIYYLGVMFLFSAFGTMFVVISLAKANKGPLTRSSWFENPFSFSQPFQFYHMAAWLVLADGAIHLCATYLRHHVVNSNGLIMFTVGIGVRLGVAISAGLLEHRFENESTTPTRFKNNDHSTFL